MNVLTCLSAKGELAQRRPRVLNLTPRAAALGTIGGGIRVLPEVACQPAYVT